MLKNILTVLAFIIISMTSAYAEDTETVKADAVVKSSFWALAQNAERIMPESPLTLSKAMNHALLNRNCGSDWMSSDEDIYKQWVSCRNENNDPILSFYAYGKIVHTDASVKVDELVLHERTFSSSTKYLQPVDLPEIGRVIYEIEIQGLNIRGYSE